MAARMRLKPGDMITQVDEQEVSSPETLQSLTRHKSYTTTQRYINLANQVNRAVEGLHVPDVLQKRDAGLNRNCMQVACRPSRRKRQPRSSHRKLLRGFVLTSGQGRN